MNSVQTVYRGKVLDIGLRGQAKIMTCTRPESVRPRIRGALCILLTRKPLITTSSLSRVRTGLCQSERVHRPGTR